MPVPRTILQDIGRELAMPVTVLPTGLGRLERAVSAALEEFRG